ncbi:hypothetical protein D3C85_441000 [compost metagenome]
MNKIHHIIEDVLTVALYDEAVAIPNLQSQIEQSITVVILRRTLYRHVVVRAKVSRLTGVARIEVDLFDSKEQLKPVAHVEYVHAPNHVEQPVKARKLCDVQDS